MTHKPGTQQNTDAPRATRVVHTDRTISVAVDTDERVTMMSTHVPTPVL